MRQGGSENIKTFDSMVVKALPVTVILSGHSSVLCKKSNR